MITLIVEDGEGKRFTIEFRSREVAIDFAERSQTYRRPMDKVVRIDTTYGELVWKS